MQVIGRPTTLRVIQGGKTTPKKPDASVRLAQAAAPGSHHKLSAAEIDALHHMQDFSGEGNDGSFSAITRADTPDL